MNYLRPELLDALARAHALGTLSPGAARRFTRLVARSALAGLDGLVLRWLVDRNTDALITGLDDLISMITVKAIASPIDATPAVRPISRA
jgi:hypothetical protein